MFNQPVLVKQLKTNLRHAPISKFSFFSSSSSSSFFVNLTSVATVVIIWIGEGLFLNFETYTLHAEAIGHKVYDPGCMTVWQ